MPQILKNRYNFTLRWLLDFLNTSLEQNLRLKTLDYLFFIPAAAPWLTFGYYWGNSLTHPMLIIVFDYQFLLQRWRGGVGSLLLNEWPVDFDHNDINHLPNHPKLQKILKGDKQILKNYRPISLLPIAGKIFERLLYYRMFEFFIANNLMSKNQSGFRPGNSCINQLLSITHEIYQCFDDSLKVRAVFLDISKAFDKVWHKGLIFKLTQNGISDKTLNIITDFLSSRR